MGTWNATCTVTQLPIHEGERAVMVPLIVFSQDFSRHTRICGFGSSDNTEFAQPFALPLFGNYNGGGGLDLDNNQPGLPLFLDQLKEWAQEGRLFKGSPSKKVPLQPQQVSETTLQDLASKELFLEEPNRYKLRLAELLEVYNRLPPDQQRGMSHYAADLAIARAPDKIPDTLLHGLALSFIPEVLYCSLAALEGATDAYRDPTEKPRTTSPLDSTQRALLRHYCTLAPETRARAQEIAALMEASLTEAAKAEAPNPPSALEVNELKTFLGTELLGDSPFRRNGYRFYSPTLVNVLILNTAVFDDERTRTLWVEFHLFSSAFAEARRQWVPQTSAGSSATLGESRPVFNAIHKFVAAQLKKKH